ncbi:MAG TPA: cytochrome B [Bacteroidia bacterium]|nr:cytochrome B [Bacteroidia bacterium]
MYTGLLHTHSLLRWVFLILLITVIVKAWGGMKSKRAFTGGDKKLVLMTVITAHVQLLIGIMLYMSSPIVKTALNDMGAAMKDGLLRFWAVEHISAMVLAIILITIGHASAKRAVTDAAKFKKLFIFFVIGLVIILATIPWPFQQMHAFRGWI